MELFTLDAKDLEIAEVLKRLDPVNMTPLEALTVLADLKSEL